MATSLEQYVAEATNAYKPAQSAIQSQIDALAGQLDTANEQINRNYANQQSELENQRNQAASAASMQAAGSGGSFGGMANIANRKYYEQSFVPAQTRLQTNQANDLAQARQYYNNQRTSLNSQLSNIAAQANEMALNKYWSAIEAEKDRQWQAEQAEKARQAQRAAAAEQASAQNAYNQLLLDAVRNSKSVPEYSLSSERNMYGGYDWLDSQGNPVKIATVAAAAAGATSGEEFNRQLYSALQKAAAQGDYYSQLAADRIAQGARYRVDTNNDITNNNFLQTLGLFQMQ